MMSRSIKKNGIVKDKGLARSVYNKRFRRVNKQRLRIGKELKLMREVVNDWEVCDYKFIWPEKNFYWFSNEPETDEEHRKRKRMYFGK